MIQKFLDWYNGKDLEEKEELMNNHIVSVLVSAILVSFPYIPPEDFHKGKIHPERLVKIRITSENMEKETIQLRLFDLRKILWVVNSLIEKSSDNVERYSLVGIKLLRRFRDTLLKTESQILAEVKDSKIIAVGGDKNG